MLEFATTPLDVNLSSLKIDARQVFSSWTPSLPFNKKEVAETLETAYIIHPLTGKIIEIDPAQLWFWSREWQEGEYRVDKELESGQYEEFDNIDDFINTL
jgi:hypothetical protein